MKRPLANALTPALLISLTTTLTATLATLVPLPASGSPAAHEAGTETAPQIVADIAPAVTLETAPEVTSEPLPTPAERQIAAARKAIAARPDNYRAHNALALALARRARETSKVDFYRQGDRELEISFQLQPGNLEGERDRIWILLGKHEFAAALEAATKLNRRVPDDLMTYALLADANIQLGHYSAAENAVQWMLDLRPGNVLAMTRGAHLREIFGDLDGALDWMRLAYERTRTSESEDRAWLATHIAHLEIERGELGRAEQALTTALALYPDYHYAIAKQADLRTAQGRFDDAAALRRHHTEIAPHAENFFYLGEALVRAGHGEEADRVFARFERLALAESHKVDNANRELVRYYLDYAPAPQAALDVATHEVERRQDVETLHVYALALAANHRLEPAAAAMAQALEPGGEKPEILLDAGELALARGDQAAALDYFERALARNTGSAIARRAREEIGRSAVAAR